MNSDFPQSVSRIVDDYLDRLSAHLKGMPGADREELLTEIRSHIFESYREEASPDEIDRILKVLRRLGEPTDVASTRFANAVERMGRGKKAPLYILAGVLIALFGVPLGLGAIAILVGLLIALFGLLVGYFGAAVSFVVAGFLTAILCGIAIVNPEILFSVNRMSGTQVFQFGPFQHNPELAGLIGLIVSVIILALGLLMLWGGRFLWKGFCFVCLLIARNLRAVFVRFRGPRRLSKSVNGLVHTP
jgi:uncharacterized membrane protein